MTSLVVKDGLEPSHLSPGVALVEAADLRRRAARGSLLRYLRAYGSVVLLTQDIDGLRRPLVTELAMRWVSRGSCEAQAADGRRVRVDAREVAGRIADFTTALVRIRGIRRRAVLEVQRLERQGEERRRPSAGKIVYVRSDLDVGLISGGSVGHTSGIVNSFDAMTEGVVFVTPSTMPMIADGVETHVISAPRGLWDFPEIAEIEFAHRLARVARQTLGWRAISFVYQRYSSYNYSGLALARQYRVPFLLEYNGSAVWIGRNWGRRLQNEELAERIELLNLRAADVVVVVSDAMREELLGRGIPEERILVNPNGVDPETYSPSVDGAQVRARYGLEGRCVVGFIGTYQAWHGASVLAKAIVALGERHPDSLEQLRVLMIGEGPELPDVQRILGEAGLLGITRFTGRTHQSEGPGLLAACDILVSPHVPNADGSRFFGSPTKLFEYMAMGKAIVASNLEQIGEVLTDQVSAVLVPPGDEGALADAIHGLLDDRPRRERLGEAARARVVASYTWLAHSRRILDALGDVRA